MLKNVIVILFSVILLSCTNIEGVIVNHTETDGSNESQNKEDVFSTHAIANDDNFLGVVASSELTTNKGIRYNAENLFDSTYLSWVESEPDAGIGSTLIYNFSEAVVITHLDIVNGFGDLRFYHKNNRVKVLTISNNAGDIFSLDILDTYVGQTYELPHPIIGDVFTISIIDIYQGSKWNDTCISELVLATKTTKNYSSMFFVNAEKHSYFLDFYDTLIPQHYLEENRIFYEYQVAFSDFIYSGERINNGLDYRSEHYAEFLLAYPEYKNIFPHYSEGDSGETNDIKLISSAFGFQGVVFYGGMSGDGKTTLSNKAFILTDDDDFLVINSKASSYIDAGFVLKGCNGNISFELNGKAVPVSSIISIPSHEELFPDGIPSPLVVQYYYNDKYIKSDYYNLEYLNEDIKQEEPVKTLIYDWNGRTFIHR